MNKDKILCKIVYYFSQKSLDEIQLKVQKVEEDFIVKVLKNKVLILTFFITNEGRFALDKKSSTNDLSLFKSITAYCNTRIKRPMLDCFSFRYESKQIVFSNDFSFKQKTNLLDYLKNKGHTYNS